MKQEIEDVDAWIDEIHVMTEDEEREWRAKQSPETLAIVDAFNNSGNSYWDYRVVRKTDPVGEFVYGICEVYYADNKPIMLSEPEAVMGETLEEMVDDMAMQYAALKKPVLDAETRTDVEPAHLTET